MCHDNRKRAGFTLIELLVVIAIIGVLAALTVLMFPSFTNRKRASNGASMLQGWLYTAKQRAFRDKAPRGLRLMVDPAAPSVVTQCQFLETPDDFTGGIVETPLDPTTGAPLLDRLAIKAGVDFTQGSPNPAFWLVQPGDFLELQGMGVPHQIARTSLAVPNPITYNALTATNTVRLSSPLPFPIPKPGTPQYRIMRAPRVIGDEPLKLPDDVAVDLMTNASYGNPLPALNAEGGIDIMFSPSGKLIAPGAAVDFFALWVRDTTTTDIFANAPTVLALHVRSGLVAGHPPAPAPANPYQYVIDGRNP